MQLFFENQGLYLNYKKLNLEEKCSFYSSNQMSFNQIYAILCNFWTSLQKEQFSETTLTEQLPWNEHVSLNTLPFRHSLHYFARSTSKMSSHRYESTHKHTH